MDDVTPSPLISPRALADRLGAPGLVLLDATWTYPGGPQPRATGRINGAVAFEIDAVADQASDLPHMLPTPEAFADALARLGVGAGAETVIYDRIGLFSAPRVWWSFRAMGVDGARVLDGGLPAWIADGFAVEPEPAPPAAAAASPNPVAARLRPELVCDRAGVEAHVAGRDAQIVDARPKARFTGEAEESRPGLRRGHMPGARNLCFRDVLTEDWRMRPESELRALAEASGVDLGAPIVTTCGSGVSAATLALAFAVLGRDDVAVYDGSWAEWGRVGGPPVETGP